MAAEVPLPLREPGESHGAYYRRCALIWLTTPGERDPDELALVLRLGALASRAGREAPPAGNAPPAEA